MSFFKKNRWVIFVIILIITLLCAYLSRMGNNPVSNVINSVLSPVQSQIIKVTNPVSRLVDFLSEMKNYKEENERLKTENNKLMSELKSVEEYKAENERLQRILEISEEMTQMKTVAAKVIEYSPDNWFSYITINRGKSSGIEVSDAVITADGLLGQVSEVGSNWAKISTLINTENSVGVRIVRNGEIGIVEGDTKLSKTNKCRLGYLTANASVLSGDILETSGLGGIYPPKIMVGKISQISKDNMGRLDYAVVEPVVELDSLYEVLVITDWILESEPEYVPEDETGEISEEAENINTEEAVG